MTLIDAILKALNDLKTKVTVIVEQDIMHLGSQGGLL